MQAIAKNQKDVILFNDIKVCSHWIILQDKESFDVFIITGEFPTDIKCSCLTDNYFIDEGWTEKLLNDYNIYAFDNRKDYIEKQLEFLDIKLQNFSKY
jgi:hypothetical protein